MTGQEMATAVQYGINAVVVVVDNGTYGTIRMHQERDYPGRGRGHRPANPDFAAYAAAFGAWAVTVETTADFPAAFDAGAQGRAAGPDPPQDRRRGHRAGPHAQPAAGRQIGAGC